ncbi:MAG: hypothetical protein ABR999_02800 [Methanoregula sp.]|uniref:hypothetical protein n=1 Tax=Methanoregula sp. TaxID=2052170 RepID=UPI003D0C8B7A
MKASAFIAIIFLICVAVALAGCTSSQSTVTTSGSTAGSSGTPSSSSLTTSPTDVMPDNIAVTVTVGEKDYLGKIPVTFEGGQGQVNVKKIDITLTRADGSTQTATLGSNKGDIFNLDGTRGSGSLTGQADRVQVSVTMNNGQIYKIVDVLREYRTRG